MRRTSPGFARRERFESVGVVRILLESFGRGGVRTRGSSHLGRPELRDPCRRRRWTRIRYLHLGRRTGADDVRPVRRLLLPTCRGRERTGCPRSHAGNPASSRRSLALPRSHGRSFSPRTKVSLKRARDSSGPVDSGSSLFREAPIPEAVVCGRKDVCREWAVRRGHVRVLRPIASPIDPPEMPEAEGPHAGPRHQLRTSRPGRAPVASPFS